MAPDIVLVNLQVYAEALPLSLIRFSGLKRAPDLQDPGYIPVAKAFQSFAVVASGRAIVEFAAWGHKK